MNPIAYQSYLKALNSGDSSDFDYSVLSTEDSNTCIFTMKNYKTI